MRRDITGWKSQALHGRDTELACFGDYGVPLILFPTAGGDFLECERFLMIRALSPLIEAKRLKVYACGTVTREAWMDQDAHPGHKSWLQGRWDRYLHDELIPFIRRDCGGYDKVWAAGASLGAFNAVLAATRSPGDIAGVVAMSGTYTMDRWMHGHVDSEYFFCQPMRFLPGLDGPALDALRQTTMVLATGQGRWEAPQETVDLARVLDGKGVPNTLELWGHDCDHDWPTWRTMLPMFLDRLVP